MIPIPKSVFSPQFHSPPRAHWQMYGWVVKPLPSSWSSQNFKPHLRCNSGKFLAGAEDIAASARALCGFFWGNTTLPSHWAVNSAMVSLACIFASRGNCNPLLETQKVVSKSRSCQSQLHWRMIRPLGICPTSLCLLVHRHSYSLFDSQQHS